MSIPLLLSDLVALVRDARAVIQSVGAAEGRPLADLDAAVHAARKADSVGGRRVTRAEWHHILSHVLAVGAALQDIDTTAARRLAGDCLRLAGAVAVLVAP